MEWLSQNWIWLAFAAAMIFMMRRGGAGGAGGCCGGGHGGGDKHPESGEPQSKNATGGAAGHQH